MRDDEAVRWIQDRMKTAQLYLGPIDGDFGSDSQNAFDRLLSAAGLRLPPPPVSAFRAPFQSQMTAFYGPAGNPDCVAGSCFLPFPFVVAWDTDERITKFACHKKVEAQFTAIWRDAVAHYGEEKFKQLRLNHYSGCYNYRKMRESDALSIHSWGCAYDVDHTRNGFTTYGPEATLSGAEYIPFWNIVEKHGAFSLGRRSNRDWMHFQFARWA